jgi:phage terminase large subunit-like protein
VGRVTGRDAIRWIEKFCRIPAGPKVGRRVKLLPFQREIIAGIFGTPTRRAIISMGRQNAKTTLCAYLLLLHLCGPRHQRNGLLVSSALTREQAAIVFGTAAKIVRLSPELAATVQVVEHQKILRCAALGTVYRALSADAPQQLGLSPFFVVHDELGAVEGPYSKLYDVLESGSAVQADPLSVIISTQARTDTDLLSRLIDDAATGADPKTKLFLWTADPDADLLDEAAWKAANPALGHFLNLAEVRAQAETARRLPSMEASFRNLILNQRIDSVSRFISPTIWAENGAAPSPLDGATVSGGLDLASVNDLCGLELVAEDGSVHTFPWLPAEGLAERSRRDKAEYEAWAKAGLLLTTPGRAVNYDTVAVFLRVIFNRCNVKVIAFDRVMMRFLHPCLVRAGFSEAELAKFVPHGQGFYGMAPAIRELETRLLEKTLRHGNHPVLTMCAANAAVVTDDANNRKFTKRKSTGRIDCLVALAMACGAAAGPQPPAQQHQMWILGPPERGASWAHR